MLIQRIIDCESGNKINAQNPTSSAKGLCQMIKSTQDYVERNIGKIDWNSYESQYNACKWLLKDQGTSPWGTKNTNWGTFHCWNKT